MLSADLELLRWKLRDADPVRVANGDLVALVDRALDAMIVDARALEEAAFGQAFRQAQAIEAGIAQGRLIDMSKHLKGVSHGQ